MRVPYLLWQQDTRRVTGFSIVASENWAVQQGGLEKRGLSMAPLFDGSLVEQFRSQGPQNFKVEEDGAIVLLPPEQRNLTPQIVVSGDDQLMLLNQKMDLMIELLTKLPERMGEATEAAMRRAIH